MAFGGWAASHLLRNRPGRREGLERAPFDLRRTAAPADLANPGSKALGALCDGWAFTQPQVVQGTRVLYGFLSAESTRYQRTTSCIKSKDEVFDCFVQFVNEAENLTGKRLKILRCDNGKEYLNNRIYKFARDKGIRINNCPTYVHELNGTAERYNRTVIDMARCLLAEAKVYKRYWPKIVCTAVYLKNRILVNTIERKIPFEIFFGRKPSVENLHLYGSNVFVRTKESF